MKLERKLLGLAIFPALILLGAGCSGINASHSVSPASFFLPGLIQAEPPAPSESDPSLPFLSEHVQLAVKSN